MPYDISNMLTFRNDRHDIEIDVMFWSQSLSKSEILPAYVLLPYLHNDACAWNL